MKMQVENAALEPHTLNPSHLRKRDQKKFLLQFAEFHGSMDVDKSDNSLKDISDKEHEKEERRKVILGLLGGAGRKDQEPQPEEPSLDDSSDGMPPLVAMTYSELSPISLRGVHKLIEVE